MKPPCCCFGHQAAPTTSRLSGASVRLEENGIPLTGNLPLYQGSRSCRKSFRFWKAKRSGRSSHERWPVTKDDIKGLGYDDEVSAVRKNDLNGKRKALDSTKNHFRSRSVPTAVTPQLCGTTTVLIRRRTGQQLGLGIAGGADRSIPPIISFLRPGFIAHRCDQLQPGERILSVNNIPVRPLTHDQILTVLRSSGDTVKLEIEYSLNDPVFNIPKNTMHKCAEILLEKETGGFGFTIRGGSYGPDLGKARPITITAIRPGSPAHREGRLRVGDRIININGVDVFSATLGVAQNLIREVDLCGKFVIEYDVSILETVRNATGPLMVEVDKTPGSNFGVILVICERSDPLTNIPKRGVFVESVKPATVADRCGAIHAGDEILSIDGIGLEFTTLDEATQLLKGHGLTVKLEIIPYSQMNHDAQKLRRRAKTTHETTAPQDKENASRSESCGRAVIGVRASEPRTQSVDKYTNSNTPKRFQSNAISRQKIPGLSGSVPAVQPDSLPVAHHELSRSVVVEPPLIYNGQLTSSVTGSFFSAIPSGQVCHMETMEVVLQMQSTFKGGAGLLLNRNDARSTDADSGRYAPLFIAYIEKNSPADKCGVLQVGDRILAINDWHTANSTIDEANHILRHASPSVMLTVEFDVIESVLPSCGIFMVKLAKRGSNLGIVCRSETNNAKGEPVVISEIRTGSVAHRCGSIQPGDHIVAIDNIPLDSCSVEEAIRLLQRSGEVVKLNVRKGPNGGQENDVSQMVAYSIELSRKGNPLGITIASTGERGDPIIISQLTANGLAERTGALHVGDRILAINNESLEGKTVAEAMQILQQSIDIVSLKITRFVDSPHPQFVVPFTPMSPVLSRVPLSIGKVTAASAGQQLSTIRSDSASDTSGKLSTPIQSIDSAVESLEDSPNSNANKNLQMSSSHHGGRYNDELHKRTTDTSVARRSELVTSGRQNSSASARSFSKPPSSSETGNSVERIGWDSGLSSTGDASHTANDCCNCANNNVENEEDWKRILEALETVGEEEMLKKLEESIMSGNVPSSKHNCQCSILSNAEDHRAAQTLLARRNHPAGPTLPSFSGITANTILRQPVLTPQIPHSSIETQLETCGERPTSPCSDETSELPPAMPPTTHIAVSDSLGSTPSPRRLSNLLMMLSDHNASIPMIDAAGPINNDLDNFPTETIIFSVSLKKDPVLRTFGFSVSDINQGVYINSLSPGSPADKCGRLRPLDRILKINDTDIQDLGCNMAVPLLAASEVRLLIERTTIISPNPSQKGPLCGSTIQSSV